MINLNREQTHNLRTAIGVIFTAADSIRAFGPNELYIQMIQNNAETCLRILNPVSAEAILRRLDDNLDVWRGGLDSGREL